MIQNCSVCQTRESDIISDPTTKYQLHQLTSCLGDGFPSRDEILYAQMREARGYIYVRNY